MDKRKEDDYKSVLSQGFSFKSRKYSEMPKKKIILIIYGI